MEFRYLGDRMWYKEAIKFKYNPTLTYNEINNLE